ncbi:uncharacterized protein LTR77_008261 [Saxophila tyrrhenica]|uniref:3-hydroxyisobutyrate dehydrogenase n=1 Tax=Saxophila tyrrhenica TaxID=1690608 RepID=A0AAV9P342_9PEZI|nr:hypothetical protein LTR77_008261 [Saxophila tyrrhenica]
MAQSQPNGNSAQAKTVGYIGLGNAGYPLASTLARAGYQLVVRDADPSRAEQFSKEHSDAAQATKPDDASAFKDVDVLVTMLPNGSIVRDVLLGSSGVASAMKSGSVIIDTSSSSPFHTRETGKLLQKANPGVTLIDSPVTQEYAHALAKGDATLMVGCSDQAALDLAMPVLKVMGKHVFVMGELGAGHAMKTLNNYTSAASIMGLCDALITGQKFGLDPAKMVDVMNVGTGVNFSTKESFRTDGLTRNFASGYQLSLLLKDMKIARTLIDEMGPHSALSDLIVDSFAESDKIAGPGACHTQVIEGWEKRAGIQLKQKKE